MTNLTLNLIKSKSLCEDGYEKLLDSLGKTRADDEPVSIEHILESNGINDTLWVIFNCIKGREMDKRNLLADIAESVLHIFEAKCPNDDRPRKAIEGLRDEEVGKEELERLRDDAAEAAADAAANSAYWAAKAATKAAAEAAAWAAANAAWAAEREKRKQLIIKWFGGK